MRKSLAILLTLILLLTFFTPVFAAQLSPEDIVVLYTNDVHTYIDGPLSYDVIAAIKQELQSQYAHVLLVDAGDHVQGTAYGSMDNGKTIINLMNAAGYDLATLGNHEFDYGMQGCLNVIDWADYPYVSCNFHHESNGVTGDPVLDAYRLFDCGERTIAFIGITTPETFSKSTPAYFQDGNGNYIYGISGGADGKALYAQVQKAINDAKAQGAETVIALGHLGDDPSSGAWTSENTIAGVSGLNAFIDGHSHSTVEGRQVTDKSGEKVLLTQTGEYFGRIGMMVIDDKTGAIETDFIECAPVYDEDGETVLRYELTSDLYAGTKCISSPDVARIKDAWITAIDEKLGEVIGCAKVTLDNYDADGTRLVRKRETNTGDFSADALYYLFDDMGLDVDVAVMNGGGVRNQALTGDISYLTCKNIHPFGNVACLQTVSGQQLLDMLEWSAKMAGSEEENGSFLHVSGLTFKIDTSIPSTVQGDEKDIWIGGPTGEYRVHEVKIYNKETAAWEELDLKAEYNLAGYNYTLRDLGGGYAMLSGAVNVLDYVMEDYLVLANYIQGFPNGVVDASNSPLAAKYKNFKLDYSSVEGSGRIVMEDGSAETAYTDLAADAWYTDAVAYVTAHGLMTGVGEKKFSPESTASRAMIATILWRLEGEPSCGQGKSGTFADVPEYCWYTEAVEWAAATGIVSGYGDALQSFGPNDPVTREQLAAMLYRYEQYKGGGFSGLWMFLLDFADRAEVSEWAYEGLCWLTMKGVISGRGNGVLDPKADAVRCELAQILMNYLKVKEQ